MNYYNVFWKQFDGNEHFSPFEFILAGVKIGVWINSTDLNNLARPYFEIGSDDEKFRVWNEPMHISMTDCSFTTDFRAFWFSLTLDF